jgi:hypothetical protein
MTIAGLLPPTACVRTHTLSGHQIILKNRCSHADRATHLMACDTTGKILERRMLCASAALLSTLHGIGRFGWTKGRRQYRPSEFTLAKPQ